MSAVFGAAPDVRWYQALLGKDIAFFMDWQMQIAHAAAADGVGQLVCDPVEFYNPLHDLANAMAHGVARLLEQRTKTPVPVWTFPILIAPQQVGRGEQEIRLTEAMLVQKQKAIVDYTPLKAETVQLAEMLRSEFERLYPEGVGYTWPQKTDRKPFYEEWGEARIRQARYETLITYRDHVRPTALRLLEHSRLLGEL